MILQLMGENNNGSSPDQGDLETWASRYDVTFPVLADPNWRIGSRYEQDGYIPTWTLMAPGLEILAVDEILSESRVIAELPEE